MLTNALIKLINKSYWTSAQSEDGCMSAEENELSEMCIKTLTVSITYMYSISIKKITDFITY